MWWAHAGERAGGGAGARMEAAAQAAAAACADVRQRGIAAVIV